MLILYQEKGKLKKKPAGSASQNPPGRLLIRNSKELFIE